MRSASYILFSTSHRAPRFLASFPTRRSSDLQVTTGGSDPRIMTPGVQLNMVTKRGTNDFRGSGRYFYTPGSYQAEATVPAEADRKSTRLNSSHITTSYAVFCLKKKRWMRPSR